MEIAGLAVGVPGLFAVCLDIIEKIEVYKSSGTHSRQLVARFDSSKLKLREWASGVGISDGKLLEDHHLRLDVPEVAAVVKNLLYSVCEVFEQVEQLQTRLHLPPNQTKAQDWSFLGDGDRNTARARPAAFSKRHGFTWTIKGKNQLDSQVEIFEVLVDKLYDVVSPKSEIGIKRVGTNKSLSGAATEETSEELAVLQQDLKIFMQETKRNTMQLAYSSIDEWLRVSKTDRQYEKHIDERLEGTCDWIFQHQAYTTWTSTEPSGQAAKFLWIHAPAGHGKSVLCARIFQNLTESGLNPCAYVSATGHSQARDRPDETIRLWISQLVRTSRVAFDLVWDNLQSDRTSSQALLSEIWTTFGSLVSRTDNCTLILDGFDEYDRLSSKRKDFLRQLKKVIAGTGTRCLITSRVDTDIELELSEASTDPDEQLVMLECKITQEELRADIELYSKAVVTERLPRKDETLQHELAAEMAVKCEGMFLWIKLQQDQLRGGKNQKELRGIVKSMPQGLDQSYDRNWDAIQKLSESDRRRAICTLRWVTFSLRPLTVLELTEALAVELDDESEDLPKDDLPDTIDEDYINDEIKSLCCSLVEVRATAEKSSLGSQTVHLVHGSVKEYLVSILPPPLTDHDLPGTMTGNKTHNAHLAMVCLRYLGFKEVWQAPKDRTSSEHSWSFLEYAAFQWYKHTYASSPDVEVLSRAINKFFKPHSPSFEAWAKHMDKYESEDGNDIEESSFGNMYFASMFGLVPTMVYLRDQGCTDVNTVGHRYGTPLQAACAFGRQKAFELLLDWGADVDIHAGTFGSALNAAAAEGENDMVKLLLDRKADTTFADNAGWTALNSAANNGHLEAVRLLLEHGADVTTTNETGWTPFNAAADSGHIEVTKLLLEHGADISKGNLKGRTPLQAAADKGHVEMVQLLLNLGADVTSVDMYGWTPLNSAADSGRLEVVKLLLQNGADATVANEDGWSPLHSAADAGHIEVVKLLLDNGANISVANEKGRTPLQSAADEGHLEIVKLLIERGADVTAVDTYGWTPLNTAADSGHLEIVQYLIEQGTSDITVGTNDGWGPLHAAADSGHLKVAQLLIDHGADISAVSDYGWTPLNSAADSGHLEIVQLLLDRGATEVSVGTKEGWAPLHAAADHGHTKVVQLLLEHGADITMLSKNGWSPLNSAADSGHLEVVKLLLDKGADVSVATETNWTPLNSAADNGNVEIAKLFLQHNADPNVASDKGWTPLLTAADGGHVEMVDLLLQHGANVNIVEAKGNTPLRAAATKGFTKIVRLLCKQDVEVDTASLEGWTPLHIAANEGFLEIVELLLQHGADPNVTSSSGFTPLTSAALGGYLQVVKQLLDNKAKVDLATSEKRWTALHMAAKSGYLEIGKLLLERGASLNATNDKSYTPLNLAARHAHSEFVKLLIQHGAKLNATNKSGEKLLKSASAHGAIELVNLLIKEGVNVNYKNSGQTPLNMAASGGHLEVVKVLIKHGADLNVKSRRGHTPLKDVYGSDALIISARIVVVPTPAVQEDIGEGFWLAIQGALLRSHHIFAHRQLSRDGAARGIPSNAYDRP